MVRGFLFACLSMSVLADRDFDEMEIGIQGLDFEAWATNEELTNEIVDLTKTEVHGLLTDVKDVIVTIEESSTAGSEPSDFGVDFDEMEVPALEIGIQGGAWATNEELTNEIVDLTKTEVHGLLPDVKDVIVTIEESSTAGSEPSDFVGEFVETEIGFQGWDFHALSENEELTNEIVDLTKTEVLGLLADVEGTDVIVTIEESSTAGSECNSECRRLLNASLDGRQDSLTALGATDDVAIENE